MRPISYRIGYQSEPYTNSVEVHPQLSNNRHPVDGALVGAGFIVTLKSYTDDEKSLHFEPSKQANS
jgi:hypothetical protein